jgi:hypothetical protein
MRFRLPAKLTADIVAGDADALIAAYGDGAYEQARTRAREERLGKVLSGNRPGG